MRAIQVGRHDAAVVSAMLAVVAFAQFDPCNLGDRIGFIGWLQYPCEQRVLAHRLFCMLWVDARRAQKQQLLNIVLMRGLNDVGLDHQVVIDKICRVNVVSLNAANFCRCQIHLIDLMLFEKSLNRLLVKQVQRVTASRDNPAIPQRM